MTETTADRRERLYVGGAWVDAADTIEVTDLADGGVFAAVAAADESGARAALAAAERGGRAMAETTVVERARWLRRIAEELDGRAAELAAIVVRETGKPIAAARSEVASAAERFRRAAAETRNLDGEFVEGTTAGHEGWRAVVRPEPLGTVLAIGPYNYPLATTALQVAPALAAGNGVVCKPASRTPVSAARLADCVDAVGLPDGAFNYLPGRSSVVGDVLAGDDRVDAIAMTGSSAAGERVARRSGMVRLHMELGGNAPAVVCADADLDAAAGAAANGSCKYAGQRCSAVGRVLAHESVHDELVERIDSALDAFRPGDLFDESTTLAPLVDEGQAEWVEGLVDDATARGATLVRGGDRDGRLFQPTLLADVPRDARVLREEQFGPVCPVTRIADADDAVALANEGDLAIDAAVFTADYDRALDLADRIEAGAVRINGPPSHGLGDIPFGGRKKSGIGREGLGYTIEAFTTTKSIVL